jgi:hypothetical protein
VRTYKQKFVECERSNRLMWKSLEVWHRVVAESLTGGARFIASVPGSYTGETHTIYLLHRTGQVVVVMEGGDTSWTERTASLFESVDDALYAREEWSMPDGNKRNTVFYRDPGCRDCFGTWEWWQTGRPLRRKTVILNCVRWTLVWLPRIP